MTGGTPKGVLKRRAATFYLLAKHGCIPTADDAATATSQRFSQPQSGAVIQPGGFSPRTANSKTKIAFPASGRQKISQLRTAWLRARLISNRLDSLRCTD
jgi:hypothetical protein